MYMIRLGAFGKKKFYAAQQAVVTENEVFKFKRFQITSRQSAFCESIARHLTPTRVPE
jgi:hypothetical protein